MITFGGGLLLGLALIIPIGAQNVFVINQSITVGMPRALAAVAAAGVCDSILIVAGAAGVSAILFGVPGLRPVLLLAGALFLLYLGVRSLRASAPDDDTKAHESLSLRAVATRTASVSLLNPHAILDTVGVLGAAIAAQESTQRALFATGTLTASWVWFLALAIGASAARRFLTAQGRMWVDRISGLILLVFAMFLAIECAHTVL
ncbi:MAG: LysE/ArgO family amino acid transporter [Pseudonocardiaceae bacterium]